MKIGHLFDAIEIDSLDPRRFSHHLADAWRRIRFAKPKAGYAGSDRIGAALIGTDNFAWKSSGWFDSSGITFPAGLLPKTHEERCAHLEWMIDCRRDRDTLKYLLEAVSRQLPARADAGKKAVRRTTLVDLVTGLERLEEQDPRLVSALLTGRLWQVCIWIKKKQEPLEKIDHINTILWMMIIWALFDLQVIAYRLFHAEWNPLDAGMDSPENMTLESLEKIAKELAGMAGRATASFRTGGGVDDVDPQLRTFIERHDLLANASKTADRLGIDEKTLRTGEFKRKDLVRYLRYLQHKLNRVLKAFEKKGRRPRYTVVGYAHHAAGTSKARYAKAGGDRAKSREIKHTVATVRFSVSALTALLYAVEGVVEELGSLPSRGRVDVRARSRPTAAKQLFGSHQRARITTALFTVYRDLFVRPAKNGSEEIVPSEYHRDFAVPAEAAIAAGRNDPGLEPLLPEWRSRPMKPLYGGVPARRQLAQGVDYGAGNRDLQEPGVWQAKRVSSEIKADTKALRDLQSNTQARRHFRTRAARVASNFGGGIAQRLNLTKDDSSEG